MISSEVKICYLNNGFDALLSSSDKIAVEKRVEEMLIQGWRQLGGVGKIKNMQGDEGFAATLIKWSQV